MAYVSKQWKDRLVEYPNRRTITHDDLTQEVVSVNRNEGTIYEAGDVLDSVNMNNLESRIAAGLAEKQNTLTAGTGITIVNDVISATGGGGGGAVIDDTTTALDKTWSSSKIDSELDDKQDTLTAGTGISIVNNVISATGGGGGSESHARNLILGGDDLRAPKMPSNFSLVNGTFSPNYGFVFSSISPFNLTVGGFDSYPNKFDTSKTYTLRMQIFIAGTLYYHKIENIGQAPLMFVSFELGGVTFGIEMISLSSTQLKFNNFSSDSDGPILQALSLIEDTQSELPLNFTESQLVYSLSQKLTVKDLTGTLTAGNTSITFSDASILTNSTIDVYTDSFGINPTNISVSTGSVTLTFAALQSALGVKVRVS